MHTILVTGGAGFIGANFIRLASRSTDAHIINVDALRYSAHPRTVAELSLLPNYTLVRGEVCDRELLRDLLRLHRPSFVVHFAAETHVDRSIDRPADFITSNVNGTLELLEAVREHHATLTDDELQSFRLIHVSTDEVYGTLGEQGKFSDDSPYMPNSPYAASKAASDHLVRAWHHTYGLPCIITHCSNNYGPYQFPEKLIPHMIMRALRGMPLPVYGDGMHVRDWIFVDDHCDALLQVARRGVPGETYNIGADCESTNIELVRTLCRLLDEMAPASQPYETQIEMVSDRPAHDRRYALDSQKTRRELQWRPAESLESGLRKTTQWYLNRADWYEDAGGGGYSLERIGLGTGVRT